MSQTLCLPFYKISITGLYGLKGPLSCSQNRENTPRSGATMGSTRTPTQDQFRLHPHHSAAFAEQPGARANRNSIVVVPPIGMSQLCIPV